MKPAGVVAAAALLLPALAAGAGLDWNDLLRKGLDVAEREIKNQQQKPSTLQPKDNSAASQAENNPAPVPTVAAATQPVMATSADLLPLRRVPLVVGEMGLNLLVEVDGSVKSWGFPDGVVNYLGDGTLGARKTPEPIPGVHDIVDAAVAPGHALLLARDGTVLTWGRNRELRAHRHRRQKTAHAFFRGGRA